METKPRLDTPEDYYKFYGNWSKAIRALAIQGVSRSEIAKRLNKRPQHVRNVLTTPLKRPQSKEEQPQPQPQSTTTVTTVTTVATRKPQGKES